MDLNFKWLKKFTVILATLDSSKLDKSTNIQQQKPVQSFPLMSLHRTASLNFHI